MRRTVASLIPISAAIVRVLQWVALAGLDCVVLRISSSLRLAEMAGLRPGRGASFSRPVRSNCRNRFRQRAAFWLLRFKVAAISKSVLPSTLAYFVFLPFHLWGMAMLIGISAVLVPLMGTPDDTI